MVCFCYRRRSAALPRLNADGEPPGFGYNGNVASSSAGSIMLRTSSYRPPGLDELALKRLNVEIMLRLQEDGVAAISDTTVRGRHCLRVAINNHRTRRSDLDLLVREILRFGRELGSQDEGGG